MAGVCLLVQFGSSPDTVRVCVQVGPITLSLLAWETVDGGVLTNNGKVGNPKDDRTDGLVWSAGRTLAACLAWPGMSAWLQSLPRASTPASTGDDASDACDEPTIIELGCGPALVSCVLAQLGCQRLVVTDSSGDRLVIPCQPKSPARHSSIASVAD